MRPLPLALLVACSASPTPEATPLGPAVGPSFCPAGLDAVEPRVDAILAALTEDEKLAQLAGLGADPATGVWPTPALPAHGLPGLRMVDGPRGVARNVGNATAFPVGAARGATWDPALEARVGEAMGHEARAFSANVLLAPTLNVLRHPRWGRAQETYGEDPVHLGAMASGFVRGLQATGVAASAKHYAANSIEDTRFQVDVQLDDRALREVYLPHFEAVVTEGVSSVMSAYNRVNGAYCAENPTLLRQILKGEWGFLGFVESDWGFGTRSTVPSLEAGLDIEMPSANFYGAPLRAALASGEVDPELVDDAVRRILRVQLCLGMDAAPAPDPAVVEGEDHLALAREVAARAVVLLTHDGAALPLPADARVALLGPLADVANIGDTGSSAVNPSRVVTPLEGLRAAVDAVDLLPPPPWGADELAALRAADAAVVVVGLTSADEGESLIGAGDREAYDLPEDQAALVRAVAAEHDRVIVVLEGGAAMGVEGFVDDVEALLMAWYPGAQGGHGLADVLLGKVDARGRLPHAWAATDDDLPPFDNRSLTVTYDRWHGQRWLDRAGRRARFPLGYGLSLTTWTVDDLQVDGDTATVTITNTGDRAGHQLVQAWASPPQDDPHDRPAKVLLAFAHSPEVAPGQQATVRLDLDARPSPTRRWDDDAGWVVDPGAWTLRVGAHADELPLSAPWTP